MLNESTLEYLSTLTCRANSKSWINVIPLGCLYWEDEMPDFYYLEKTYGVDFYPVLQMFLFRAQLWKGGVLTDEQQKLWDEIYSHAPNWALFQRLEISDIELQAQEAAERSADEFDKAFDACADEFGATEE
jgi:hypothetical protein